MYTRAYYDDAPSIPESYGGTAFSEPVQEGAFVPPSVGQAKISPQMQHVPDEEPEAVEEEVPVLGKNVREERGFLGSLLERLPFKKLFMDGGGFLQRLDIGLEEILIIAVAALLIFSKEGDRAFGFMLLSLLLID